MTKRRGYDHERLGISFQELGALLATRSLLESGTVTHVAMGFCSHSKPYVDPHEHGFSMRFAMQEQGCGTLGCIGGTMAMIMGKEPARYTESGGGPTGSMHNYGPMRNLFYPPHSRQSSTDWDRITPQVAVMAIDLFLASKEINWVKLVEAHGLTVRQVTTRAKAYAKKRDAFMRELEAQQVREQNRLVRETSTS